MSIDFYLLSKIASSETQIAPAPIEPGNPEEASTAAEVAVVPAEAQAAQVEGSLSVAAPGSNSKPTSRNNSRSNSRANSRANTPHASTSGAAAGGSEPGDFNPDDDEAPTSETSDAVGGDEHGQAGELTLPVPDINITRSEDGLQRPLSPEQHSVSVNGAVSPVPTPHEGSGETPIGVFAEKYDYDDAPPSPSQVFCGCIVWSNYIQFQQAKDSSPGTPVAITPTPEALVEAVTPTLEEEQASHEEIERRRALVEVGFAK
jgi:hypothetical protein